ACAPQAGPVGPSTGALEAARAARPKVLTIGIQREPPTFNAYLTQGGSTSGGANQVWPMVHDYLIVQVNKEAGLWEPRLALENVSLEQGTWRVNADGTMDTTWKLRPNVKWQDGAPFDADDLLFSFAVYRDPAIPN